LETLRSYIERKYASKAEFAREQDVFPQQVTRWLNSGYFVVDDKMLRVVRDMGKK